MRLSKKLFFLLIVLLPINLGKHFEVSDSFVWGILSDYLVPVLFVQDLVIIGILLTWFKEKGFFFKNKLFDFFNLRLVQVIIFLLFSVGFSVLSSSRLIPSLAIFLRLVLYIALFFYVVFEIDLKKDFLRIVKILSVSVFFLSVLAVGQFIKQGAVFNNYLFLGEQPYSLHTWGIDRELVLGRAVVPSYGLFRHPNIFAGFLSLTLLWLLIYIKESRLIKTAFFLGLAALFLTFSFVAWVGFVLGLLSFWYIRSFEGVDIVIKKKRVVIIFIVLFLLVNICTPLLTNFENPSLSRRGSLYELSTKTILKNPFFGVGPGNFVVGLGDLAFTQPVHNIFLLIFSENGFFSLIFFALLIAMAVHKTITPSYFFIFLISILQIVFMGTLDHYFWTIHQTQLLMWLTFGFALSRNP